MSNGTLQNLLQIQTPDKGSTHLRKGTTLGHISPDGSRIKLGMNRNEVFVLVLRNRIYTISKEIRCYIPPETPSAGLKAGIAPDSTADEGSFYSMDTIEIKASLKQFISRR